MTFGAALLALAPGCAWLSAKPQQQVAAKRIVDSALKELRNGNFERAEDTFLRARSRYPNDVEVLSWSAEMLRMQGRELESLDVLLELTRVETLSPESRRQVTGQIGDLLFRLGRFGESSHFLRSVREGEVLKERQVKALITLGLPYLQRKLAYRPAESRLVAGIWPSLLCGFGAKSRICVLDTGSSMSVLAASLAREVGVTDLREMGQVRDSLGREHDVRIGVLAQLNFAGIEVGPLPVLVMGDSRMSLRHPLGGPKVAPKAILGLDVLSRFRFVLDMTQQLVRVERPREMSVRATERCLSVQGCLILPVRVDGTSMWFILDTAASHSSLSTQGLRALPGGVRRATPDYRPLATLGGGFVSQKVSKLVLHASAVRFTEIELPVVSRVISGPFPVHGVLGVDLLKHCRLTLDGGRILLERVGAVPDRR